MDFSRLSSIREDNDLKQSDMARILNVEQSNISRWENNKEIIPLDKLNMYANYFNVSLDYLTKLSNNKKNSPNVLTIWETSSGYVHKRVHFLEFRGNSLP